MAYGNKSCPFMSDSKSIGYCRGHLCAVWSTEHQCCSFKAIALELKLLNPNPKG